MGENDQQERIRLDALFELNGTSREARAYAFLHAAFRRTEIGANPVRDALDCLIPFIVPHLNSIAGKQVDIETMREFLRSTYGFSFPLYAVEQLVVEAQKQGYIEYNRITRRHIAKGGDTEFEVAKSEIETDFDEIVESLTDYAVGLGYDKPPPSKAWADALITFLRSNTEYSSVKITVVKGAPIDPVRSESAIVGNFIRNLYHHNPEKFQKILNVFMGIMVEEFISSVSEIGSVDEKPDTIIFYDTAVLLRLLGTSGKLLKNATDELTRYLQDLGFQIYYFSGNESEVENIFFTLVSLRDQGKELEGETATAIADGEVSISDIRSLQNSFPERLAAMNVFPEDRLGASANDAIRHQIDEKGFESYLLHKANENGKAYGAQNREHDAKYLGNIMRLRRGVKTRDLMKAKFVFVTTNKFLARMSKRYLIEEKAIQPQHFPPMLSVGQVATIAWLLKDHKLSPDKAGRDLLSNCFAAVRPDAEWFKYFREGVEKIKGDIEEYGENNTMALQAARRIAQEESFGSNALVRELNMAEVLSKAEAESARLEAERRAEIEALRQAGEKAQQESASKSAKELEAQRQRLEFEAAERLAAENLRAKKDGQREIARKNARSVLRLLRWLLFFFFLSSVAITVWEFVSGGKSIIGAIATLVLGGLTVASAADLVGLQPAKDFFDRLERRLTDLLLR